MIVEYLFFATSGIIASRFDSLDFGRLRLLEIYNSETFLKIMLGDSTSDFFGCHNQTQRSSLKSSMSPKFTVTTVKFEVEKLNRTNNFDI